MLGPVTSGDDAPAFPDGIPESLPAQLRFDSPPMVEKALFDRSVIRELGEAFTPHSFRLVGLSLVEIEITEEQEHGRKAEDKDTGGCGFWGDAF